MPRPKISRGDAISKGTPTTLAARAEHAIAHLVAEPARQSLARPLNAAERLALLGFRPRFPASDELVIELVDGIQLAVLPTAALGGKPLLIVRSSYADGLLSDVAVLRFADLDTLCRSFKSLVLAK